MVLRLTPGSPWRPGFIATIVGAIRATHHHELDASVGASGPHDLMSNRFFGLLKTKEIPENKGLFRFLPDE
jgi:hypothetical protein